MPCMPATEARRTRLRWAAVIPMAPLLLLGSPCRSFAADLVFSGSLERVRHESVSVKFTDRRVIEARLPNTPRLAAQALVARYNIGDHVEITCKPIQPVWEEEASRFQNLEVAKLRFLRPPSPEELSGTLASRPWRGGVNLLRRPAATGTAGNTPPGDADATLAHAREVNLSYASTLPNFVADETAKRYTSRIGPTQWLYRDTIESEITIRGIRSSRQHIRQDGRPWNQPFQALPGFKWYGGFGTEIEPVFDPECPTMIEFEGSREMRGEHLLAYRYSSPPDGCFGPFSSGYQRYNPARTGYVFIDDPGGHLIQLEETASGFPDGFGFAQRKEEVSWDWVKIGDTTHLLPVGADFVVRLSSGDWWHVIVQYTNHRHFESSTSITFR